MDRLTSLAVFGRVVECGGFSAAARKLNMSVTAVSSHVQALEDGLGVRLLNRTTRRVRPTGIGQAYYERSRQILQELDEADRMAGALQAQPSGTLRLYAGAHIIRLLMPTVAAFAAHHPKVSIDLTLGERLVDLVGEGFDLAIWHLPPPDSRLVVRRLMPWRCILCCAPAYLKTHDAPSRPHDLMRHNCLRYAFYPFGDEWRFTDREGKPAAVRVSGNVATNSPHTLRRLALDGRGVLLGPSFVVGDDIRAGRLVRLLKDHIPVEFAINAIYPHRHHLSTTVRAFIEMAAAEFARAGTINSACRTSLRSGRSRATG